MTPGTEPLQRFRCFASDFPSATVRGILVQRFVVWGIARMTWIRTVTGFLLIGFLAACAQQGPGTSADGHPGSAVSPATEPSSGSRSILAGSGVRPPPPLPPQRPRTVAKAKILPEPEPRTREVPTRKLPFVSLVGLDANQLLEQMGTPVDVRIQSPATVWEYRFSGCSLELFLFRDVSRQLLKALSFETQGQDVDTATGRDERCPAPTGDASADG